jgi:hypothetical protein
VVSRTLAAARRIRGMNAQEHYQEAEHLITAPNGTAKPREREIALAQVHATLALAAAIASSTGERLDATPAFPIPKP